MKTAPLWPWLLGGAALAVAAVALSRGEEPQLAGGPAPAPPRSPLVCADDLLAMPLDLQRMVLEGVRSGWTAATPVPTTVQGLVAAAASLDPATQESLCRAVRSLATAQG